MALPAIAARQESATTRSALSHIKFGSPDIFIFPRWWNSVRVKPGHTTLIFIFVFESSVWSDSVWTVK